MPLPDVSLPGGIHAFCSPEWLPSKRRPGCLDKHYSKVLSIPSNPELLVSTIQEVTEILANLPLSKDHQIALAMVASDLLMNAIDCGKNDPEQTIDIGVQYIPGIMVSVGITDLLGKMPLELLKLDPTTVEKLAELSEHGRGIFIARCTGDLVIYIPRDAGPEKEILIAVCPDREEVPDVTNTVSNL
jgi:hypothetical protein